jgi:predicted TIM-barrel enzyme
MIGIIFSYSLLQTYRQVPRAGLFAVATDSAAGLSSTPEPLDSLTSRGRSVRRDIIVLCHGGPSDEPGQVGKALIRMPGVAGFFGASSIERLPTERGILGQVQDFKKMKVVLP